MIMIEFSKLMEVMIKKHQQEKVDGAKLNQN
jgi:hypothetical protein